MKQPSDDVGGFDADSYLAAKDPKPATFDPDSYLASKQPQQFDPNAYIASKTADRVVQLAADPNFDAANYALQTGDTETAFQARQEIRNRSLGQKAAAFGQALTEPETYGNALAGAGKFALGLVATPLHTLAQGAATVGAPIAGALGATNLQRTLENEQQTQGAEGVLAAQQIEQGLRGLGRGARNVAQDLTGTDQDEATQRAHFQQEIEAARNSQQLAQNKPLETGVVGGVEKAITGLPTLAEAYSPEALQAQGARPVSQLLTQSMAASADPANLAIPLAGEIPGVKQIAGGFVQAGGKVLQIPENIMGMIPRFAAAAEGHPISFASFAIRHPAAAASIAAPLAFGKVLGFAGRALDEQGGALRSGIPSTADVTAQSAASAGESAIAANASRYLGNTANNMVATALGFAPINYLMSGGDPRQFAQQEVGAGVMGGVMGLAGDRARLQDVAKYRLAQYGSQQFTDNPMWAAHEAQMAKFSPEDQAQINVLRGTLYGGTGTDVLVLDGPSFSKQIGAIGGDARGQYASDGKTIYINADAVGKTPTEKGEGVLSTAGHETGHAIVDFLSKAGREGDAQALLSSIGKAITPDQLRAITDDYHGKLLASTDTTGKTPQEIEAIKSKIAADNPPEKILEENLSEITRRILSGKPLASYALPKPLLERAIDAAQGWMEQRGWSPMIDPNANLSFKAQMVRDAARRMNGILYEVSKTASGKMGEGPTAMQELLKARNDLAESPQITPDMPAARAGAIQRTREAAQKRITELEGQLGITLPAPEASPAKGDATATSIAARQRIAEQETLSGLASLYGSTPQSELKKSISAVQAESGPYTDTEQLIRAVLARANKIKSQPPAEAATPTPEATKPAIIVPVGKTFNDENGMAYEISGPSNEVARIGDIVTHQGKPYRVTGINSDGSVQATETNSPQNSKPTTTLQANSYSRVNVEKSKTLNEGSLSASPPNEPLPPERGGVRTGVVEPPSTPEPIQVSTDDMDRIAAQARQEFLADKALAKAGKNKGQHTKENQRLADKAAFDAVAEAHAQSVPPNYQGIRQRVDAFGKKTISGNIDPSRPFDSWLIGQAMKEGTLTPESLNTLLNFQDVIGQMVSYDYGHAPVIEEGEQPTKESRAIQQAQHTVKKRLSGESPMQVEEKTSIPLNVGFNSGSKSFTVFGASPEKLLNNFNHISEAMQHLGMDLPYRDINDPRLVADIKAVIRNHQNGWQGDGSRPAIGTAEYPNAANPDWANSPERTQIPADRFEFVNMMLGDEGAKAMNRAGDAFTPEAKAKAHLANENRRLINEAGEVNETRQKINDAMGAQTDAGGKSSTWSKINLEDPLSENISPALASDIREPSQSDASIRQHGKLGDLARFFEGGKTPSRSKTAAGFLPSDKSKEEEPTKPAETSQSQPPTNPPSLGETSKENNEPPEEGNTPAERLAREAEQSGVTMSLETLKGLLRGDQDSFAKVRAMIQTKTGRSARFMPTDTMRDDMSGQFSWLDSEAKKLGYSGAQQLTEQDPAAFTKMAAAWRIYHPRDEAGMLLQNDRSRAINSLLYGDEKSDSTRPIAGARNALGDAESFVRAGNGAGSTVARTSQREQQLAALIEFAQANNLVAKRLPFDRESAHAGMEHAVNFDEDSQRWLKATTGDGYLMGMYPTATKSGGWELRSGSPLEYLESRNLQNKIFGDDIRLHGILSKNGNASVITSQPHIQGETPTRSQIDSAMSDKGFSRMDDATYYRKSDNVAIFDLHPENALIHKDALLPIDAIVVHPSEQLLDALKDSQLALLNRKPAPSNAANFMDAARLAANFMPSKKYNPESDKTPIINESDAPWIQRFEVLMKKDYDGKLKEGEDEELDQLHQRLIKEYGSITAFDKIREASGIPKPQGKNLK